MLRKLRTNLLFLIVAAIALGIGCGLRLPVQPDKAQHEQGCQQQKHDPSDPLPFFLHAGFLLT